MSDTRPAWKFTEMSEGAFRSIYGFGRIAAVRADYEMTGADTSREWLIVANSSGQEMRLPQGWSRALYFVGYAHVPGLFDFTHTGKNMIQAVQLIDEWEKKHAADRATYERLKVKFEGGAR